jgi:CheY-like chemotaxis protein
VSRIYPRGIAEAEEHGANRFDQRRVVASRQIRPPDRSGEQSVADEQILVFLTGTADLQTNTARAMAWRVMGPNLEIAESDHQVGGVEQVDRRRGRFDPQPEECSLFDRAFIEEQVVAMEVDRDLQGALGGGHSGDMVDVGMSQQNLADRQRFLPGECQQSGNFIARVDQHTLPGARAGDDEAVFEEGADRLCLDYDHLVILAIVDDLMFTSKIRTAATHLGVPLVFARSSAAALSEMRASAPSLVILDLNSPRTDPIGTVSAMKADPALAAISTVGFVSHVQTELIDRARQAGVGEVMARSAFTERLPEILLRGK